MPQIGVNKSGVKIVEIRKIKFKGKRKINWKNVEEYLKCYIGEKYIMDSLNDVIYIGTDFPDEYANSQDSVKAKGTIGRAKANAAQAIPELIKTAENITFKENMEKKHRVDAKFGWYRCTVHFSLPICNDRGNTIGENGFQGRMIIRCDADGKKYLYDIVNIKKET